MKILNRVLRILLIILASLIVILVLFLAVSIAPVDRQPVQTTGVYTTMMKRLDSLSFPDQARAGKFLVGFSKVNLTPAQRTSTAGYGNRLGKLFSSVHDSIYVRSVVIDNGSRRVAVVSADLLIIPPSVTAVLERELPSIGFSLDNTYLGAVHSHNSIGNWGEGAIQFIYGPYQDSVVQFIAAAIIQSIQKASGSMLESDISFADIPVSGLVSNRLIDNGPEDPLLRFIEIARSDSTRLVMTSFTAHATCLYSKDLELSADYPGKFVAMLERQGYDFAMFMAGSVGSHKCDVPNFGWECIDHMATGLARALEEGHTNLRPLAGSALWMERVPLALPDPQVKISANWKVRSWVFRSAFREYPAYLTGLRIGNLIMLGTPCDFSGEFDARLDSMAKERNAKLMFTSFNGGYIGYVTPSVYFDIDHYETRLMNWYPPGNGEYISACLEKMLVTMAE